MGNNLIFSYLSRYTRHLENSISFFGVGGKQAAFYLGEGVRIFTKMAGGDVLEFGMSRDGFNENIEANESNPFHGLARRLLICTVGFCSFCGNRELVFAKAGRHQAFR